MKSIKNILISIISVLLVLLIILFSVQTIDYAINHKTYNEVNKFFTNIDTLSKNDMCMQNFGEVIKYNTIRGNIAPKGPKIPTQNKLSKLPLKPELYSKAIASCNKFKSDVAAIEIPQNIPNDRQTLLKQYVKSNSEVTDLLLHKLDKYKNYNGYMNNEDYKGTMTFQTYRLRANMKLTKIQAGKRLSWDYFLISFPQELNIKKQLKLSDEIQKRMAKQKK